MNKSISVSTITNNHLNMILTRLKDKFRYRNKEKTTNKIYEIERIENVYTKVCKYNQKQLNEKTHLVIRFTAKDEDGIICLNLLLDNYEDLI